jgi:hypothetical protein
MAGSFNHLVDEDGKFKFDSIENLGDAYEACEQCFYIIQHLADGDLGIINQALNTLGYPDVDLEEKKRWAENDENP